MAALEAAARAIRSYERRIDDAEALKEATEVSLAWLLKQSSSHWFCSRGSSHDEDAQDRNEVLVFLLRLLMYKAKEGDLKVFRDRLTQCLDKCVDCVDGFHAAKQAYEKSWLIYATSRQEVEAFTKGFAQRERERLQQVCDEAGLMASESSNPLSRLPEGVLHYMLSSPLLYESDDLFPIILAACRKDAAPIKGLPKVASAGLISFALHTDSALRGFAHAQLKRCTAISLTDLKAASRFHSIEILLRRALGEEPPGSDIILSASSELWQGLEAVARVLKGDALTFSVASGKARAREGVAPTTLLRYVCSHLGDRDAAALPSLLKLWTVILEQAGTAMWEEEDVDYAEVVLSGLLDNVAYENVLRGGEETMVVDIDEVERPPDPSLSTWLLPYLRTVASSAQIFPSSLGTIALVFLDRLQSPRFTDAQRAAAAHAGLDVFRAIFLPLDDNDKGWPHAEAARGQVLDVYAGILSELAFGKAATKAQGPMLKVALASAAFLQDVCERDSRLVLGSVLEVAKAGARIFESRQKQKNKQAEPIVDAIHPVALRKAIWTRMHETSRASHSVLGIATLLRGLQPCLHLDYLTNTVYNKPQKSQDEAAIRPAMAAINRFFDFARQPLLEELHDIADSDTTRISRFFDASGTPRVIEVLVQAVLAPSEELHVAAISIVRNAFDFVSRADCFRALLENAAIDTVRGLRFALKAFSDAGETLLGPIANASRLARCLTDLLEVFCESGRGLLRNQRWITANRLRRSLRQVWQLMCAIITLIFRKTVSWAEYHETQNMTAWMRDAVLLGEGIVDVVQDFENVVDDSKNGKDKADEDVNLVAYLNRLFDGVWMWIRLNDSDLLALVKGLLNKLIDAFVRARVPLSKDAINRLVRYASPKDGRQSTMLTPADLKQFCIALSRHPAHAKAFENVEGVAEAPRKDKRQQIEQWNKVMPSGGSKSKEVIELDDEDEPPAKKAAVQVKPLPGAKPGKLAQSAMLPFASKTLSMDKKPSLPQPRLPPPRVPSSARPAPAARPVPVVRPTHQMNYSHKAVDKRRKQLDSSDSEGDEDIVTGAGVNGLSNMQESPGKASRAFRNVEGAHRQVQQLDVVDAKGRGATRQGKGRSAEPDVRMRIAPDFTNLHRTILQWDYSSDSSIPPFIPPRAGQIPAHFGSATDYIETFEPLLMLETWSQLMRAKEDVRTAADNPPISCHITGRQTVDDFVDVFLVISSGNIPERGRLTEADLAVIRTGKSAALAKVQNISRKRDQMDVTVRCHFGKDTSGAGHALVSQATVQLVKLFSLSTTHREYTALHQVPYLDLASDILNARLRTLAQPEPAHVQRVMQAQRLNEPQAQAVLGVLRTQGFSLIQGPPGTGKTSTILGLVGALLSERRSEEAAGHLLICAPSNAAVDELVKRLKEGVRQRDGTLYLPRVVRVGAESAVNLNARDVFIDELVEARLSGGGDESSKSKSAAALTKIRGEIDSLKQIRDAKQIEKAAVGANAALLAQLDVEIRDIRRKITDLGVSLETEKDKQTQSNRAADAERRRVRTEILTSADVICSTLSGSGHEYVAQLGFDFSTVIIDEAAQSVELGSLIPLKYGCKRCILVGDPNQLPPTILSRPAMDAGYDQSLFVRLMRQNRDAVHLLSIQYRMHPQISAFPSHEFYEGRLRDGADMVAKTQQPWHAQALFSPYCFMHVKNGAEEQGSSHSILNREEAGVAVALYDGLKRSFSNVDLDFRVGVITTYRAQLMELKKQFRQRFGQQVVSTIDFNTVDGFQGQEKDVIILSCVRGSPGDTKGSIGFLSDFRRMNVALTRARSSLFILGNAPALEKNIRWGNLIKDARERGCFREVDRSTFSRLSTASAPVVLSPARRLSKGKSNSTIVDQTLTELMTPREISQLGKPPSPTVIKRKMSSASISQETLVDAKAPLPKSRPSSPKRPKPSPTLLAATNGHAAPSSSRGGAPARGRAQRPSGPSLFMPKKPAGRGRGS